MMVIEELTNSRSKDDEACPVIFNELSHGVREGRENAVSYEALNPAEGIKVSLGAIALQSL